MATAAFAHTRYAPSFASLPDPNVRGAILSSFLLHIALLIALPLFLMFLPKPTAYIHAPVEIISIRTQEPLILSRLPRISSSGSSGAPETSAASASSAKSKTQSTASRGKRSSRPTETVYAGLQEIHSELPHPTNRVQSILRPDLVNPPKLKFPLRLQSMVAVPSPAAPTLAPPQEKIAETPLPPVPVVATELADRPAIPLPASPPHAAGAEPEPSSKQSEVKPPPAVLPDPTVINTKTALVINAVEVPKSTVEIPDAEIAGNFSVIPSESAEKGSAAGTSTSVATGDATGVAGDNGSASATGTDKGGNSKGGSTSGLAGAKREGSGSGERRSGAGGRVGNGSGSAARAGAGTASGPGGGAGTIPGSGNGNFPGISIMGGSGGSGRSRTPPRTRPGYELTIVSGGSSGGASRDLGVFGRHETVYTVYIPMSDAGGGADWSMQYAEMGVPQSGNGLLTPPVASKKVPALVPGGSLQATEGRVFVSGVIAEDGTMHELRAIQRHDDVAKIAVEALSKWEFLPAQLNDKPVPAKVLIGVVMQRTQ